MSKVVYNSGPCVTLPMKDGDKMKGTVVVFAGSNKMSEETLAAIKKDKRVEKMFSDKVLEVKEMKAKPEGKPEVQEAKVTEGK